MASKKEVLETLIENDIIALGYELEYVENICENKDNIIKIVLDKAGTVTTEDCEKVSKALEDKIDGLVNYPSGYVLEVSSPGLERKLKSLKLYKKYLGSNVQIKLYEKLNETKELVGILDEVNEEYIILLIGENKVKIDFQNIACGNTVYNFEGE